MIILELSVGREFRVQDIGVHSEFNNCVVTLVVMSKFLNLLGASRVCALNRDQLIILGSYLGESGKSSLFWVLFL